MLLLVSPLVLVPLSMSVVSVPVHMLVPVPVTPARLAERGYQAIAVDLFGEDVSRGGMEAALASGEPVRLARALAAYSVRKHSDATI